MALHCINTKSKDFKMLVQETGINPIKLAANVAEWQQKFNTDTFPTVNQIDRYVNALSGRSEVRLKHFRGKSIRSLTNVLDSVAESDSKLAPVAELLRSKTAKDTSVTLRISNVDDKHLGRYFHKDKKIELLEDRMTGVAVDRAILHESIHYLTHEIIESDSKVANDFKALHDYARTTIKNANPNLSQEELNDRFYGIKDVHEFAAELFSNGEFINTLKQIPASKNVDKYDNLFTEIMDYILSILGIGQDNNLYNQAFSIASNIIETNYQIDEYSASIDQIKESRDINLEGIDAAIMPFNPDNNEAINYGIGLNGELIGTILVNNEGYISSSIGQEGVEIWKEYRGKGYATKAYLAVAKELAKQGKTLKSEAFGKDSINESANRVWQSLIRQGYAVDKGMYYEVILPSVTKESRDISQLSLFDESSENPNTPNFNKLPSKSTTPTMTYAGIGSRSTPTTIQNQMTELATNLESIGYTLRSGHAQGADLAFESGVTNNQNKEIFLAQDANDQTRTIAKEIHPNPRALSKSTIGLNLMARNTNQVFGKDLDKPVDFIITWTPDAVTHHNQRTIKTGGTGQAISMASLKGIPVINMANSNWRSELDNILSTINQTKPEPSSVRQHFAIESGNLNVHDFYNFTMNDFKDDHTIVNHVNRMLSYVAFEHFDELSTLTIEDLNSKNETIKSKIINAYQDYVAALIEDGTLTNEQENFNIEIYYELVNENSEMWSNFINYFSSVYKIAIVDIDQIVANYGFNEIPAIFDDTLQLKQNRTDSTPSKIKFLLSAVPTKDNKHTGLKEVVELDKLLNRLIVLHNNDKTKDDYIRSLEFLEKQEYPGLNSLINQLKENEDLFAAYYSSLNYDLAQVYSLLTTRAGDKQTVSMQISNRNSFVQNRLYDQWDNNLHSAFLFNAFKTISQKYEANVSEKDSETGLPLKDRKRVNHNDFIENKINLNNPDSNTEGLSELARLLAYIGIDITEQSFLALYDEYKNDNKLGEFGTGILEPISRILSEADDVNTSGKKEFIPSHVYKGSLMSFARRYAKYSPTRVQLDYLNVNNDMVYTPIYQSYIGRIFKGLTTVQAVRNTFEKFTQDTKFQHSNLLWNDTSIGSSGIFNYIEKNGKKVIYETDPVNMRFVEDLTYEFFNGQKSIGEGLGITYSKILNKGWDFVTLLAGVQNKYFVHSADSGRISSITMDLGITLKNFADNVKIDKNGKVTNINTDIDSKVFKLTKNTILSELTEMRRFAKMLFNIKDGKLTKKKVDISKLHRFKHFDGKTTLENGKPTGRVFQFLNLTYKTKDGVTHYLHDRFDDFSYLESGVDVDSTINKFIVDAVRNNIERAIEEFSSLESILEKQTPYITDKTLSKEQRSKKYDENKYFPNKQSLYNNIGRYYINNYLAQVEINNIISGNPNEYKDSADINKRVNESIKNGLTTYSTEAFNSITAADIKAKTKFIKALREIHPSLEDYYSNEITVPDGLSIISDIEFKKRAKLYGRYSDYATLLDDLNNPNMKFNPLNYNKLIESQKNFYYGRDIDTKADPNSSEILSRQYKNSTLVLTRQMAKNMQLENLYDFLIDPNYNINSLDFESARKVGGTAAITLFDSEGNFVKPTVEDIQANRVELNYSNLIIQQDVVPHLIDTTNKLGVQLEKLGLANLIPDGAYIVSIFKDKYSGLELANHYYQLLHSNITESALDLLNEFGAVVNGEIKYVRDVKGDKTNKIDVSRKKVIEYLQNYVNKNESNDTLRKAIKSEIDGLTNIPIYSGLTAKKFQNILLALFTNNVTHQQIKGIHVPILPEFGLNPKDKNVLSDQEAFEDYKRTSGIQWTDKVHARKDYKLQINTEVKNGQLTHKIEAIVSPWDSRFYGKDGLININDLSEDIRTTFGIRIPTEGKHSTIYVEVVGFITTGASQAIFPYELVTKTGWDFDIDTVYMYMKEMEYVDSKLSAIQYSKDDNVEGRYEKYIASTKQGKKIALNYNRQLSDLYNKLHSNWQEQSDKISTLTTDLKNKERAKQLNKLYDIKQDLHNTLALHDDSELSLTPAMIDSLYILRSDLQQIDNEINQIESALSKLHYDISDARYDRKQDKDTVYNEILTIKDKILEEQKKQVSLSDFSKRSIERQNTRAARNNRLIDIYGAVVSNEQHFDEYYTPNKTTHIKEAGNHVNSLYNINIAGLNLNNYFDASVFRNINMAIRELKGNSVAWDGLMAILSTVGATITPMKFRVNIGENFVAKEKGESNKAYVNRIKDYFDEVTLIDDNTLEITVSKLGNSNLMDGYDVNDLKINTQVSEVTANILDAVKELMGFNINVHTLSVFKLLSGTSLSHLFKGKPNRFYLPYLFTHQPSIVEAVDSYNIEQVINPNTKFDFSINNLINQYESNLYALFMDDIAEKFDGKYNHPIVKAAAQSLESRGYVRLNDIDMVDFMDAFNEVYADNDLTSSLTISDVSVLENDIKLYNDFKEDKLSKIERAKYLNNQLNVLNQFKDINRRASTIVNAISTFNTDKLGAGPTFNTTKNLYTNIGRLMINKELFYNQADRSGIPGEVVKNIIDEFEGITDIKDKATYIRSKLNDLGISLQSISDLKVNNESSVEFFYPKLFNPNLDISDAKYPIFQSYLFNSNINAFEAFAQFFPHEDIWYEVKKRVYDHNNVSQNDYTDSVVNNYINSKVTNRMPFMVNTSNYNWTKRVNLESINVAAGTLDAFYIFTPNTTPNLDINIENPSDTDVHNFLNLGLNQKIRLLQNSNIVKSIIKDDKYSNAHILGLTDVKDSPAELEQKGYATYTLDSSPDINTTKQSINDMLKMDGNIGIILRNTLEGMIKNHIYLHGFNFGNNITQFIDANLLYKREGFDYSDKYGLHDYADALRQVEVKQENITEMFYKANWDNNTFVPLAKPRFRNAKIDSRYPTFSPLGRGNKNKVEDYSKPSQHIIEVDKEQLERSRYKDNNFITVEINNRKVLYKRSASETESKVYYYPINKSLPNETLNGESVVSQNYKFVVDGENSIPLYSEDTYRRAIEDYSHSVEIKDNIEILKPYIERELTKVFPKESIDIVYNYDSSPTQLVKDLGSRVNSSVYIGNNSDTFNTVLSNNKNHLHIDFDKSDYTIAKQIAKHITKNEGIEVLLLGSEFTNQEEVNSRISNILIEVVKNTPYIPRFHTLSRQGVNNAVRNNVLTNQIITYTHTKDKHKTSEPKFSEALSFDVTPLKTDNTHEDVSYLANQIRVLTKSVKTVLQYEDQYRNSDLEYKKQLSDVVNRITSDQVIPLLQERDIKSYKEALEYHYKILLPIKEHMEKVYNEIKDVAFTNELMLLEADGKVNYAKKVRQLMHLKSMFDFIDDINTISESRGNEADIESINYYIKELKKINDETGAIRNKAWGKAQEYLHGLYIAHGSNPTYDTFFTRTIKQVQKEGGYIEDGNFKPFIISNDEAIAQYAKLLSENEAMTVAILNMDSAFNTGIALMDGVMKSYIHVHADKSQVIKDHMAKMDKLFTEYFGVGVDPGRFSSHSERVTNLFKSKFINKNNELVSEYNYGAYYASYYNQINEHAKRVAQIDQYRTLLQEVILNEGEYSVNEYNEKIKDYEDRIKGLEKADKNEFKQWSANNMELDSKVVSITAEELAEIERRRSIYHDDKFNQYLRKHRYIQHNNKYIKLIPSEKYKDSKYSTLQDKDLEFLKTYKSIINDIANEVYDDVIISEDFFPVGYDSNLLHAVKQMLGIKKIQGKTAYEGLNGELRYDMDMPMLHNMRLKHIIEYDMRGVEESVADYEARILEGVNATFAKDKPFESFQELEERNKRVKEENDQIEANRNFNPIDILSQFVNTAYEYKAVKDFENIYQLLLAQVKNEQWQEILTGSKGKRQLDKILTNILGRKEYKKVSGREAKTATRLEAWGNQLWGISNIHNRWDQGMSIARSATSMAYMGANLLGGFKNVTKGYHDMLMESAARQFLDKGALSWATKQYLSNQVVFLRDAGRLYTDNLISAIFKDNPELLELRDVNGNLLNYKDNAAQVAKIFNDGVYFAMNSTEHFMQYTMLLGMMKSHRIINGIAMSYTEYLGDAREKLLLDILTDEQKVEYDKFRKVAKERFPRPTDYFDPSSEWTTTAGNITSAQRKQWADAIVKRKKDLRPQFEKYETVFDQLELRFDKAITPSGKEVKTGSRVELKNPKSFTVGSYKDFMEKVRKVNHSLHGVYNQMDKMALRNSAIWDLAFQFRSWMKPNWDRYFGKRLGRSVYNEGLRNYQKGIYVSAWQFLTKPLKTNRIYGKDERTSLQAFTNLLSHYGEFLKNMRVFYNTMPEHEQANLMRAMVNVGSILIASLTLVALGKMIDDEDREDRTISNKMLALSIYELNMIHSEITQFIPGLGWHGFYTRTKQHPLAAEKFMLDMIKLTDAMLKYPLQSDEARRYQAGPYKDRERVAVQAKKTIPIYRQVHKWEQLGMYTGWYKMYNPLSFMFGN